MTTLGRDEWHFNTSGTLLSDRTSRWLFHSLGSTLYSSSLLQVYIIVKLTLSWSMYDWGPHLSYREQLMTSLVVASASKLALFFHMQMRQNAEYGM